MKLLHVSHTGFEHHHLINLQRQVQKKKPLSINWFTKLSSTSDYNSMSYRVRVKSLWTWSLECCTEDHKKTSSFFWTQPLFLLFNTVYVFFYPTSYPLSLLFDKRNFKLLTLPCVEESPNFPFLFSALSFFFNRVLAFLSTRTAFRSLPFCSPLIFCFTLRALFFFPREKAHLAFIPSLHDLPRKPTHFPCFFRLFIAPPFSFYNAAWSRSGVRLEGRGQCRLVQSSTIDLNMHGRRVRHVWSLISGCRGVAQGAQRESS